MAIETVAVTGGSGTIGTAVLREFDGRHTVNLDRDTGDSTADDSIEIDLLDPGDVYNAIDRADADAVVHLGTYAGAGGIPEHDVYASQSATTYNVLEAAHGLDLEAACLASSIHALGSITPEAPLDVRYLPVDEDHPQTPQDPYAVGKQTIEIIADSFGRRPGSPTLSSLRIPTVLEDEDRFPEETGRDVLFGYCHIEDIARLFRAAVDGDHGGHERFWVSAADTRSARPSAELAREHYPGAEDRGLDGHEALISTAKARELLDWEPAFSWRKA
jgi:nucleoside-diphosphate-sugar epimerase